MAGAAGIEPAVAESKSAVLSFYTMPQYLILDLLLKVQFVNNFFDFLFIFF